ncbi:hypothetical protein T01_9192 [Trichinella spiralis]|uniref:Uncharacterized protein n=1 Tax=Trichinella spiralis TaxID=6334 RepID=A0A0V1BC38_TRISP|nr:hypothetical protein T01_9192 [Trichinella spiralis]
MNTEGFFRKLQNFMGYRLAFLRNFILIKESNLKNYATGKRVDTFSALHYSLLIRRTKLHCSEISKKLFPEYHDRRTTERACSNMYIHSDFFIDTDLLFPEYHDRRTTRRTCSNMYIHSDFFIDTDLLQTELKRVVDLKYK